MPSHHIETVALVVVGIVLAPVLLTGDQFLIGATVVEIDHPLRGAAMLCFEHGDQGSDQAGTGHVLCLN